MVPLAVVLVIAALAALIRRRLRVVAAFSILSGAGGAAAAPLKNRRCGAAGCDLPPAAPLAILAFVNLPL